MTARGTWTSRSAPTLRDVAALARVHPGTVSRALNEETRVLVSEETVDRVMRAAEELGYRPNSVARGLKTNRSYAVGVLIPDITNPLFPPMVRGIEDRLGADGYTPLIANTDNEADRERSDIEALQARRVDGFIAATAREESGALDAVVAAGTPLVLLNRRGDGLRQPSVTVDDRTGVRLGVEHLAGLGHERIAHVAGPADVSTGQRRRRGFADAMRAAGLTVNPRLVVAGVAFTEPEGARSCAQLLDADVPFTAIVAANDLLALGCYDALAERGLRCPRDMSVVGFNDMPFADRFAPPLTTVRVPHYELGLTAADLLVQVMEGEPPRRRMVEYPPELIVRGSTAKPR